MDASGWREGRQIMGSDAAAGLGGRIAARLASAAAALLLALSLSATPTTSRAADTLEVDVSGVVPGFTQAQLVAYLARKMQEVKAASWHFVAGRAGAAAAPDRIVWSFRTLQQVWKGSAHNGFPSPSHSTTYLRAEVKLYLDGAYQLTVSSEPSVYGGPGDEALSNMVRTVCQAVAGQAKP